MIGPRPKRWLLSYPALVAAYPVLLIASGNAAENTAGELACVYALALAAGGAVHAVVAALWRRRASADGVALAAGLANFFLFAAFQLFSRATPLAGRWVNVVLAAAALGSVALAGRASRATAVVPTVNRVAGVFCFGLAAMAVATIAVGQVRSARAYASSAVVDGLRAPLAPAVTRGPRPDVYLVILDGVPNDDVMRRVHGRENDAFSDSLRAIGFIVPAATRSNYSFTAQSVASLLNAGHVRGLETDLGATSQDRGVLYRLAQDNRVSRWFRASGYRVYVQPSISFPGTIKNESASGVFLPDGAALRFLFARSLLLRVYLEPTLPGRVLGRLGVDWQVGEERLMPLRSLASVARRKGPKFVVVHSLAAHPPFAVDSSCARSPAVAADGRESSGRFLGAARCTERTLVAAIREIIAQSARPPVILLQADHGTEALAATRDGSAQRITPEQAYERMGAFGAYYLPGGTLPDTVTPVNLFRYVLRYLGVPIEPLPDSSYFSTYERPYHFVNVTPYLDIGGTALAHGAGAGSN